MKILDNLLDFIFSPTERVEFDHDLYSKIVELEEKYNSLLLDVKRLEEENIETTNEMYRLENSLESRIDIIGEQILNQKK